MVNVNSVCEWQGPLPNPGSPRPGLLDLMGGLARGHFRW